MSTVLTRVAALLAAAWLALLLAAEHKYNPYSISNSLVNL